MNRTSIRASQYPFVLILLTFPLVCGGCSSRVNQEKVMIDGSRSNQEKVVIDGSRDVRLLVRLDLDQIANQIEKRHTAESVDNTKFGAFLDWRERLGLDAVTLMLVQETGSEVELVVMVPDAAQKIWNELTTSDLAGIYLEKNDDGTLSPKLDALPEKDELPNALQKLKMRWHDGRIVLTSPQRLERIEAGSWDVQATMASELIDRVEASDNLLTVAALVPEELDFNLEIAQQRLRTSEAVKKIPRIGHIILAMATSWFEGFRDQLKTTDAFAVGVSLPDEDQRHVRYAQLFRADDTAESVYECLTSTNTGSDGVASGIAELLHDEQVDQRVSRSGRLVEIEVAWAANADKRVASSAQLVIQSVLSSGMVSSIEPTEGPIQTRYTSPPHFVKLSSTKLKAAVVRHLRSQIFPGWANDQGEEPSMQLELDTLALPNGRLSEGRYEVVSVTTTQGKDAMRVEEKLAQPQSLQLSHPGTSYLKIPLRQGTDKSHLKSVRIQFSLNVPAHVDVVEFSVHDAAGTKKNAGKQTVKVKRIERDVADVAYRAHAAAQLFAFDKAGRPLESRESIRGGGSAAARFSGVIDKLWVAVPSKTEKLVVAVDVDLNGGQALRLPDNPSDRVPVRYDATPVESYVSLDESELHNLSVDIEATPGFADRERLLIQLPRACQGVKVDWELYWFAKDRPTTLSGYTYSQNGQLAWSAHEGLGNATAVSGWAKVVVPTDFTMFEFSKKRNGSWQTKHVGPKAVKFRIDRNQITYKTGDLALMAVDVFDATGRHLRTEYGSQGDGATSQRVWGQPDRVELVVSGKTIERVIKVDIARDGTDPAAFAAFKQQIPQYHRAFAALMQVQQAVRKGPHGYDEIAGLHYLHGRTRKPLRLIPIELAHACPQGAERFGYQPQPFSGYYFARLPADGQNNSQAGQVKKFRWAEGEFEVKASGNQAIAAIPKDVNYPTFIFRWGTAYMKFLGDKRLQAVPSQPGQDGWSEVSLVRSPRSSDNLTLSR